jgi:hypothetical protein
MSEEDVLVAGGSAMPMEQDEHNETNDQQQEQQEQHDTQPEQQQETTDEPTAHAPQQEPDATAHAPPHSATLAPSAQAGALGAPVVVASADVKVEPGLAQPLGVALAQQTAQPRFGAQSSSPPPPPPPKSNNNAPYEKKKKKKKVVVALFSFRSHNCSGRKRVNRVERKSLRMLSTFWIRYALSNRFSAAFCGFPVFFFFFFFFFFRIFFFFFF